VPACRMVCLPIRTYLGIPPGTVDVGIVPSLLIPGGLPMQFAYKINLHIFLLGLYPEEEVYVRSPVAIGLP